MIVKPNVEALGKEWLESSCKEIPSLAYSQSTFLKCVKCLTSSQGEESVGALAALGKVVLPHTKERNLPAI